MFHTVSSEEFWKGNISGFGWAFNTITVLTFIITFQYLAAKSKFSFIGWGNYKLDTPELLKKIPRSISAVAYSAISHSDSKKSTAVSQSPDPQIRVSQSPAPQIRVSQSHDPQIRNLEIVSDLDLKNLIHNLDQKPCDNEKWDNVVDKTRSCLSYNAQCCKPKDGPLKYLSVTIFENCSAEMLRDFYMDNEYRKKWDRTLTEHEQLQVDESNGTEIGRTVKKFPLLTPREYVLAWRVWEGKDRTFYCFIKECEHPLAPRQKKYVRVGFFRSGWRIRKVPGRNACEIKMVHQEDAGLNVEMAKLAFAKGIWSYVCKMDNALRRYSAIRLSVIGRPKVSSAVTAVTLIHKVPPELDPINKTIGRANLETAAVSATPTPRQIAHDGITKKSSRPSNKLIANVLILLGGVICVSRGHSNLGGKLAMAYILSKFTKRGASSSQSRQV
ncbi:uncharacterized protein LOC132284070 [Cornus florida]|uniref:uncharacterized protein LOC132284070 n=1 Tax=Cornus florida TaxID=4283 RepID=UPI00289A6DA0|nr:uncharacterized protein LOC132284070 [Cornus florida]